MVVVVVFALVVADVVANAVVVFVSAVCSGDPAVLKNGLAVPAQK